MTRTAMATRNLQMHYRLLMLTTLVVMMMMGSRASAEELICFETVCLRYYIATAGDREICQREPVPVEPCICEFVEERYRILQEQCTRLPCGRGEPYQVRESCIAAGRVTPIAIALPTPPALPEPFDRPPPATTASETPSAPTGESQPTASITPAPSASAGSISSTGGLAAENDGSSSLGAGALAGIVIGSVAGGMAISFAIWLFISRRRRKPPAVDPYMEGYDYNGGGGGGDRHMEQQLGAGGGAAAMPTELVGPGKRPGEVGNVGGSDAVRGPVEMEGIDTPRMLEDGRGGRDVQGTYN